MTEYEGRSLTKLSVHQYDAADACLTIRDHYPVSAKSTPTAAVHLHALIDGLNHELLQVGAWLNIIGYVRSAPTDVKVSRRARLTFVEATMLWSAGAIRHAKYQAAVDDLQKCIVSQPAT